MNIEIILRTCNRTEMNPDMKRILKATRDELILRCLNSFLLSVNHLHYHSLGKDKVNVTIIDDSTNDFRNKIKQKIKNLSCSKQYIYKNMTNNECMKYCYEYAKENFDEDSLIYFCEDDYLYFQNCFTEMIEAYKLFKNNLGEFSEVAIHPADSPLEYFPESLASPYSKSRIVLGRDRHWRTSVSSPFSLLLTKNAFNIHYDKFMNYSKFDGVNFHEANTINLMFIDNVTLFTPIPTLCFHLGYIDPPAPFCDHLQLWKQSK